MLFGVDSIMQVQCTTIDSNNIDEYPPTCFLNPKNEGYLTKRSWLLERFAEGMVIKVLTAEGDQKKKLHGFIEYVPGDQVWRAVDAVDYLFIHCIWISPNNVKQQGHGSKLIQSCKDDAKRQGKRGVAVIASDRAFMAGEEIFLANGFTPIAEEGKETLLAYQFENDSPLPRIRDHRKQLERYSGWHLVYTKQCPWVARFVNELDQETIDDLGLTITELRTPQEAQNAPSLYTTFNLIHDGKLLADRYISNTRFRNILRKS